MKKEFDYKKIIKYALVFTLVLSVLLLMSNQVVLADVGNNNSYDTGSSDSGDSGDVFWFIYIIFDLFGPIGGLIIVGIVVAVFFFLKKSGKLAKINLQQQNNMVNQQAMMSQNMNNNGLSQSIAMNIRQNDPNFSEDAFIGWTREVFMKIQQAWNDRNWKIIRPFESQELFSQHNQQLDEYIRNNKINKVEKICIRYCGLKHYHIDGDKEVLVVELHATMRDYVVDAKTNNVIESDPNKDWFMKYDMTFNRKKGVLTQAGVSNKSTTNCPNCGAPTEITSAGQCEYCRSIITTGEHDWVLSNIVSIK
ncbi:MAG: Tim44 domain-containing protein [Firmicutes bacterium]|nr:Tim44 domain-containing protein [Bacillota bacterium]